jgi:hypothetical protein
MGSRSKNTPKARGAVDEIGVKVAESGWKWIKQSGDKCLEAFYRAATEIFNEVANAALSIEFESGAGNSLIARWEFRFPVEDIVLNLLHRRHPTRQLVLMDGEKAFVRDGCGVRMEKADAYGRAIDRAPLRSTSWMATKP